MQMIRITVDRSSVRGDAYLPGEVLQHAHVGEKFLQKLRALVRPRHALLSHEDEFLHGVALQREYTDQEREADQ